ncbi:hypothetical protein WAI453_004797 [Rhynchosporium graminicola]
MATDLDGRTAEFLVEHSKNEDLIKVIIDHSGQRVKAPTCITTMTPALSELKEVIEKLDFVLDAAKHTQVTQNGNFS